MPSRPLLSTISPAFSRRLAKTPLRRRPQISTAPTTTSLPLSLRSFHSSASTLDRAPRPSLHARFIQAGGQDLPPPAALSALLARLALPQDPRLHDEVLACLTHPSYNPARPDDTEPSPEDPSLPNNEMFDVLGNSLLGMFATEHLAQKFPLLPTEALKMALTAYVGPAACESVARELGVGVTAGASQGLIGVGDDKRPASGIAIRWQRTDVRAPQVPIGERFSRFRDLQPRTTRSKDAEAQPEASEDGEEDVESSERSSVTFEQVIASTARSFVGLIYQEQGIHAAREFVAAHFLTRHLDLPSLFAFRNPMVVLAKVVQRHLVEAGVPSTSGAGRVQTRILAETGVQSHRPLINVGLFLPSGLKLSEGYGSSYRMAEHRAATNALLSFFLVRGDQQRQIGTIAPLPLDLPSSAHVDFPLDAQGVVIAESENFAGTGFGGLESNESSSKRSTWEGRAKAAKYVVPS